MNHFCGRCVLTLVVVFAACSFGTIVVNCKEKQAADIGSNAELFCQFDTTHNITQFIWKGNNKHVATLIYGEVDAFDPRVDILPKSGSLIIKNVNVNDSGQYEFFVTSKEDFGSGAFAFMVLEIHTTSVNEETTMISHQTLIAKLDGGQPKPLVIVGITICIFVVIFLFGFIYYIKRKKQQPNIPKKGSSNAEEEFFQYRTPDKTHEQDSLLTPDKTHAQDSLLTPVKTHEQDSLLQQPFSPNSQMQEIQKMLQLKMKDGTIKEEDKEDALHTILELKEKGDLTWELVIKSVEKLALYKIISPERVLRFYIDVQTEQLLTEWVKTDKFIEEIIDFIAREESLAETWFCILEEAIKDKKISPHKCVFLVHELYQRGELKKSVWKAYMKKLHDENDLHEEFLRAILPEDTNEVVKFAQISEDYLLINAKAVNTTIQRFVTLSEERHLFELRYEVMSKCSSFMKEINLYFTTMTLPYQPQQYWPAIQLLKFYIEKKLDINYVKTGINSRIRHDDKSTNFSPDVFGRELSRAYTNKEISNDDFNTLYEHLKAALPPSEFDEFENICKENKKVVKLRKAYPSQNLRKNTDIGTKNDTEEQDPKSIGEEQDKGLVTDDLIDR